MSISLERLSAALRDRYTIEREIGTGGMATVFLAHDVRHDRPVAVKVLRPELAALIGAQRFLNEIKVTANLQHPNILPLYDSGEADSYLFYVMPVVDGESLRDLLNRHTQLSIEDTIRITKGVAAALGYAHRNDVIHRDVKPENILLQDGQPLVADFGIALALSQAGGQRLTETGLSIGTPSYMSPEQALGDRAVDGRSDVYALACVAYEMLTGEPPHTGPTAQAIIAKIATEEPRPVARARPSTPPSLSSAIETALEKLPADRFPTAEDFAAALTRPTESLTSTSVATGVRARRRMVVAGVMALVGIAAFAAGRMTSGTSESDVPFARFAIDVGGRHIPTQTLAGWIDLSPDGQRFIYTVANVEDGAFFIRHLSDLEAVRIPGLQGMTRMGAPTFSPDGGHIAFWALPDRSFQRLPLEGGRPVQILAGPRAADITWTGDGFILIGDGATQEGTSGSGIRRIPAQGGDPVVLTTVDTANGEYAHQFPSLLPDGRLLVAIVRGMAFASRSLAVIDPDRGTHDIIGPGVRGMYAPSGHLVWAEADGRLRASALDLERLEFTGETITIADDVRGATSDGVAQFDISDDGQLIYLPGQPRQLVIVDRDGRVTPVTEQPGLYHSPRFSPDGRKVVMDITEPSGRDIWVQDLAAGTRLKITFSGNANDPIWSRDGSSVTYSSPSAGPGGYRGLFRVGSDGSSPPESLYTGTDDDRSPGDWFPGGDTLLSIAFAGLGFQLETVSGNGERRPVALPGARTTHAWPAISPDGRWLAYQSAETGFSEVYVRPLQGGEGRVLVSLDGGGAPVWHPNGRELFYRHVTDERDVLVAALLDPGPPLRVLSRTELFSTQDMESANPHTNYDVHPDGDRFVMVRLTGSTQIIYLQNWPSLFEERSN